MGALSRPVGHRFYPHRCAESLHSFQRYSWGHSILGRDLLAKPASYTHYGHVGELPRHHRFDVQFGSTILCRRALGKEVSR